MRYCQGLRDTAGNPAHAATFIRQRLILLDGELRSHRAEHARILVHELFHFVWVRLGNPARLSWEELLRLERRRARGEAGWSAEWRAQKLTAPDRERRTRRWREYCCEAFCDTAAALHAPRSAETTLPARELRRRAAWFAKHIAPAPHI